MASDVVGFDGEQLCEICIYGMDTIMLIVMKDDCRTQVSFEAE